MLKKQEYLKTVKRPYPLIFSSLVCWKYSNKDLYEGLLNESFAILDMAHVDSVWYYGKKDMEQGGKLAFKAWKDLKKFDYVKKEFKKREENLINSSKKDLKAFSKAYGEYMPALALVFALEKPLTIELQNILSKKLSLQEYDELISKLNVPLQDNFHKKEEYDLVNSTNLSEHVKNYRWLYARYGDERTYTIEEAKEKLKSINKKEFLESYKKEKELLNKTIKKAKEILENKSYLIDIFQYLIYYRTQRTDIMNKAAYLAIPMFKKTAKTYNLTYEELMHCSILEILKNRIPSQETLEQRKKDCSTILENGKVSYLTGKESQKLIEFFKDEINEVDEFKGNIACKGNIKGKAKLIFSNKDFDKINQGDILITSMTTPEMVPIMKKAAAFVTDEGGVTSHAAIISRELKKPCVIGTKIATKVLKDGDLVEVDADKGIIKIIKKTK